MKKIIFFAVLLIAVASYIGFQVTHQPPKEYLTISPSKGDVTETVLATGSLVGLTEVNVGAQVTGQVQKLYVKLGDKVAKGDMIAEIDPKTQINAIKNAEAELKIAKANKRQKLALLKQQQAEYDRQQKMRKQNATSDADLESAVAALEQTKAALESCEAEIEKALVSVSNAQTNFGYTKITAPQDGVVIGIITEEGQTVVSAQSAPTIVKLADLETMTVEAEISEADVVRVKPGMPSYFTILGLPDKKFYSTLRQIEPAPESASSESSNSSSSSAASTSAIYYNALLDVPNPDGVLRVSMTAEVTVVLGESKNVLTIPISVLQHKVAPNKYSVRVLKGTDSVEEKIVTVGRKDNINYEILDGITEEDRIIIGNDAKTAEAMSMSSQRRGPPRM